ncbi:hypothetical protein ACFPMF_27665 [Larkinella bovis]|uniref:Uncharacterized protein n=1 Tax=Larkinella bovis TaxID=683041 RepID=A0ABW0IL71_9BACT
MSYIRQIIQYLKGTASHLGTTKNLIREVVLAVMTAVGTYLVLHFVMPTEPSQVDGLKEVFQTTIRTQRQADSLETFIQLQQKQQVIDSLQYKIRQYEERDSLRANGELTTLEAMRTLIGTIKGKNRK